MTYDGTGDHGRSVDYGGNTSSAPRSINAVGFGRGRFYDGRPAQELVDAEFADQIAVGVLNGVADALPGDWVLKPDFKLSAASPSTDELRAALERMLGELASIVGDLPASIERWHNNPPERLSDDLVVLGSEDQRSFLHVVSEMRLSVISDSNRARALWDTVQPALKSVADYVLRQADAFLGTVNKTVAAGVGVAILAVLGMAVGILERAEAITALLKMLRLP